MSHFSKIKTNISDLNALTKTLKQLGFHYEFLSSDLSKTFKTNSLKNQYIAVYQDKDIHRKVPVFNFSWTGAEYLLIADQQLWKIDIDFDYFLDRLFQQYAYNIVISTSSIGGFSKVEEQLFSDGSIKVMLNRWNNN